MPVSKGVTPGERFSATRGPAGMSIAPAFARISSATARYAVTVRGGYAEGFKVAVVTDAVSSYDQELHAATLRNLGAHYCRLVTADEVISELGMADAAPAAVVATA